MKKQYLLMAAFASAMAFTACTNDDDAFVPDDNTTTVNEGQVIEIAISNTGTGTTKAARPIGSSAADNDVNEVVLQFYVKNSSDQWTKVNYATSAEAAESGAESGTADSPADLFLSIVDGENSPTMPTMGTISYSEASVDEGESTPDRETKKVRINVTGLMASTQYKIVAYG